VDVFAPSLDEIGFLLWGQVGLAPSPGLLHRLSGELLEMGAKIVALKLGEHGLYLRTTARGSALQSLGQVVPPDLADWTDFEAWQPCFQVEMVGATGSGDVTVAGLLAALLRGLGPLEAVTAALAVGACCVEAVDALSGLLPWDATLRRVRSGWPTRPEAGQFIRTGGS
jgi:sugar/nucleoside kinase (ribokinase family)